MIRLIIVDDHTVLRAGLRALLANQADFEVVSDVGEAGGVLDLVVEHEPDLVVLDLSMPGGSSMDLIEALQVVPRPPRILVLSMHDDPFYARAALSAGATGYVVKTIGEQDLLNAMRLVSSGHMLVDLDDAERTKAVFYDGRGPATTRRPSAKLSTRERDVLRLLGQGYGNQSVAEQLELSAKTVATYRARISEKLGLSTTAELVRYVSDTGLGHRPEDR